MWLRGFGVELEKVIGGLDFDFESERLRKNKKGARRKA